MLFRHQCTNENDAVYIIQPERFQIFQFLFCIVSGVRQQYLVPGIVDHFGNAVNHPCHRLRTDLRNDNANQIVSSGAQRLGRGTGTIAGAFDHFLDAFPLFLADIAVIQITGNRCGGNLRKLCDRADIHLIHLTFLLLKEPVPFSVPARADSKRRKYGQHLTRRPCQFCPGNPLDYCGFSHLL